MGFQIASQIDTRCLVSRFPAKAENRGVVVTGAGSYLRLVDSCVTQLKAQGPFRTCNESKEEEEASNPRAVNNDP